MSPAADTPLGTADLRGTGGHIGPEPEDFQVEEIPAYPPAGQGTHCFALVRKRALTSPEAARRIAWALGVSPAAVGMAGMKDRWAVTEQWMSIPDRAPADVLALALEGVTVREAHAHPHKLRTGHLRGNRFRIRIVDADPAAVDRLEALGTRLREGGVPNRFGPQRFGRDADNAARGLALLMGEKGPRDRRDRRLLVSALQSALFNEYLEARLRWESPRRPRAGEVLQRRDSGGVFLCVDPEAEAPRVAAEEVVPTGPLFGPKMKRPGPGSEAEALEAAVLQGAGVDHALFEGWRKLAPGARRPLWIPAADLAVEALAEPGTLRVTVTLPAGAYATCLLAELTHTPAARLRPAGGREDAALPDPES